MFRKVVRSMKEPYITDKLWFDCSYLDTTGVKIEAGKILLSFELVPKEEIAKKDNAQGRGAPNNYPVLPDPVGRFSFVR